MHATNVYVKIKLSSWSCDCIVKETVLNRPEQVLAYKYWCLNARFWNHQNDKKFGPVLVKLQAVYTDIFIWSYTNIWHKKFVLIFMLLYMPYLAY